MSLFELALYIEGPTILLGLCVAHLTYGLAHGAIELVPPTNRWCKQARTACHIIIVAMILIVGLLYGLEYCHSVHERHELFHGGAGESPREVHP